MTEQEDQAESQEEGAEIEDPVPLETEEPEDDGERWSSIRWGMLILGCGLFVVELTFTATPGARRSAQLELRRRETEIEAAIWAEEAPARRVLNAAEEAE